MAKSFIRNIARYIDTVADAIGADTQAKSKIVAPLDEYLDRTEHIFTTEGREKLSSLVKELIQAHHLDRTLHFDKIYDAAYRQTERDTYQAMEALIHNLCTLNARGGGQVPFSSLNMGTDTSEEGRMVIRSLLLATEAGLGAGETAIFPISIFRLKDGINTAPNDPNYDLFELACRVSAKRGFPNFISLEAPFNKKYYKPGHPETEAGSMGLAAHGTVTLVKTGTEPKAQPNETAEEFYSRWFQGDISEVGDWLITHGYISVTDFKVADEHTHYVELDGKLSILDHSAITDTDGTKYTPVKKFLFCTEPTLKWYMVEVELVIRNAVHRFTLTLTHDHPLPVAYAGAVADDSVSDKDVIRCGNMFHDYPEYSDFIRTKVDQIDLSKHPAVLYVTFNNGDRTVVPAMITRIEPLKYRFIGFDFETESDRFDLDNVISHNCRTRVISNIHDPEHEQITGRGNLFFNTINLPYLALLAKEELTASGNEVTEEQLVDVFFTKLDEVLNNCIGLCQERFEIAARRHVYNYPFLFGQYEYLGSEKLQPTDEIREAIKNGTQTVGFIGLAEALVALCGHHHGEDPHAQELGLKIVGYMNDFMTRKAEETKINYSLMGTPAEGCSGKLLRLTRKRFGVVPGVTDKEYFTNSHHRKNVAA